MTGTAFYGGAVIGFALGFLAGVFLSIQALKRDK